MAIKPLDVQSLRKSARGRLVGIATDPAIPGELYPRLEWSSAIGSVTSDGSNIQMKQRDKITVRTHPAIGFRLDRIEVWGRIEDGQPAFELTDDDVMIDPTHHNSPEESSCWTRSCP